MAPVAIKQEILNKEFEKLAANNRASFIGTEGMIDHKTGKLRNNMLDGIHFTNIAVKVYAKEIKRSLYGHVTRRNTANLQNPYQPQRRNTANLQNPYQPQSQWSSQRHEAMSTFTPQNPIVQGGCEGLINSMQRFFQQATLSLRMR